MHDTYVVNDPAQVHAWDEQTVSAQGVSSLALMERAASAFVQYFVARYPVRDFESVNVLCGPGNNGGDGAAIARLLERAGYTTYVWGWWLTSTGRAADLVSNWTALRKMGHGRMYENEDYIPTAGVDVVIDALFGVGLSRPLGGVFAKTVATANDVTAERVAVDVPSGQKIDGTQPSWLCFNATKTVTFEALKLSALLPETGPSWGSIYLTQLDLEEPPAWVQPQTPRLLDKSVLYGIVSAGFGPRDRFTHKGTYGHVLVIAGSRGHAGAALLSGKGALNAGAGLVTFYVPERLETAMQIGLPEAMCLTDPHADHLTACPPLDRYDAVVVGPGIGRHSDTATMLAALFDRIGDTPCVLDADALNLLASSDTLDNALPRRAILTPHPGEFARLASPSATGSERLNSLKAFAKTLPPPATVVLKGQYTAIATPAGELYFNFFDGNPGMGTGGMGDVLAGVIGALAARSEHTDDEHGDFLTLGAAALGVYAHAKAGDLVKAAWGEDGVTAVRVAEQIGLGLRAAYNE